MRKGKDVFGTRLYAENVRGLALEIFSYFGYWMVSAAIHHLFWLPSLSWQVGSHFFKKKKKTQIKKENIMLVDVATVKRSGDEEVGFQIYLSLKVGGEPQLSKEVGIAKTGFIHFIYR